MKPLLLGGETEYAIGATPAHGEAIPQSELLARFMNFVRAALPYTSVSDYGRFLANGGLLYLDAGLHIEWATPECTSPHDVVRYLRAGDRIIQRLAEQFAQKSRTIADVFCTRCNVDYVERTLWGSHESYLHVSPPAGLPAQLIPFLVSRVVLCGAGGWDPQSVGLSFTLSPRATLVTEAVADDTEHVRPIFHTKDEGLSDTGSHRLHVGCSETLCSDLATLLRFGTTALVLAAIDAGAYPGDAVRLRSPVRALRRFAADPSCAARAGLADRRRLTAIDIQRHYLRGVEQEIGTASMPEWAAPVCALWRQALADLEARSETLAARFDWAIKQRIYARFLRRYGVEWSALPALNSTLRRVSRALLVRGQRLSMETMLRHGGALVEAAASSGRVDVTRDQLVALMTARQQLLEIDMRFGQLGDQGIFGQLDRAGVLDHQVEGVDAIDAAMEAPPRGTRAAVRGDVVRRLTEHRTRYRADWTRIVDLDNSRALNLGDPFEAHERWKALDDAAPLRQREPVGQRQLFPSHRPS